METSKMLCSAKSLTARNDLAIGIGNVIGKLDAFDISSCLSAHNPKHEMAVKHPIRRETDLSVVCEHELSSTLGFSEETITAVGKPRLYFEECR